MNDWANAEAHAERAHEFYEAGQWEKALDELKRALAVNPQQSEWHYGLGLTLEAMGRHEDAIKAFERVLELRGEDVETMVSLALNLNRASNPKRAIEMLEWVNEIDPTHERGYCLRVEAYMLLDEHEQAELMFYMARQCTDECPECHDYIAQSLAKRGDLDKALWCWHQAARIEPYYPGVYANLARIHWQRGHHIRAQRLFLKQLRQDPGDIDTLIELGRLLIEMDRDEEAGEKFRRVLELDPTIADARLHLGELALRAEQLEKADEELQIARKLDSNLPGIHLGLAQIAQQKRQYELAVSLVRDELKRKGHRVEQILDLARLLVDLDQPKPIPAVLTPLIEAHHGDPAYREQVVTALLYRGLAYTMRGEADRGVSDYRAAVKLEPHHTVAMQNLALTYLDNGKLMRAAFWLRQAERVLPYDPILRQLRFRLGVKRVAAAASRLVRPRRKAR